MEWVETTGKTLEEARDAALDMLGVDESDAEFVTLSEPRPGLFGRLRGEARVRARVLPKAPAPKRTRSRRPTQRRESAARGPEGVEKGPAGQGAKASPRSRAGTRKAQTPDEEGEDSTSSNGSDDDLAASGSGSGTPRKRRRRPSGGSRTAAGSPENGSGETDGDDGDESKPSSNGAQRNDRQRKAKSSQEEEVVTETTSLADQGLMAKDFIEGLVGQLGLQATVTTEVLSEDAVQVAVDGDELGLLVGKGGATLSALQELARTVVQRKTGGHTDRILIDVAGYRAKRAEALTRFTQKVVEDVLASGKEMALEAMSPADRKVVHDAVNEIGGAATRSEGVEPNRYVIISPLDASAGAASEDTSS
jgi:spoIIIJ-associated protein